MENLVVLRKMAGLNQTELAKIIGISQSTLSYWERGDFEPDNESLIKLADYFGVTIDYLLGRDSPTSASFQAYDDEALALMDEMHKRPELKVLFSTSRNATKEDVEIVDQILKKMAGQSDAD